MENQNSIWNSPTGKFAKYAIVAALSCALTLFIFVPALSNSAGDKLGELKSVILRQYIGETDETLLEDMAATAMVAATGDPWSYYVPADSLQALKEYSSNSYTGIGVTVILLEDESGYQVQKVEPDSPAQEGDIRPGDIITGVNGKTALEVGAEAMLNMVSGEAGSAVQITLLREGEALEKTLTRKKILQQVASGQMLTDTVGYLRIYNFNARCADETIRIFEELEQAGAKAMIFDVRFNGGGYVSEMTEILDYLLPEGLLIRCEDYTGRVTEETSDAHCKTMPMVVLINGESYSAAEFFASALVEYDYAFTVGQPTTGKGRFQQLITLSDGSAVNLSVGKYTTSKGVDLSEVGGLVPHVPVEVDEETMANIYAEALPLAEDIQLQTALTQIQTNMDD